MSTERHLAGDISALVHITARSSRRAIGQLRAITGHRRASISLDGAWVVVGFDGNRFWTDPARRAPVDGQGSTDAQCVVDLLAGVTEVTDAILDGRLEVRGNVEAVAAILGAIEIILDLSGREPDLQDLAGQFLSRHEGPTRPAGTRARVTHWRSGTVPEAEYDLLAHLGLLPEDT